MNQYWQVFVKLLLYVYRVMNISITIRSACSKCRHRPNRTLRPYFYTKSPVNRSHKNMRNKYIIDSFEILHQGNTLRPFGPGLELRRIAGCLPSSSESRPTFRCSITWYLERGVFRKGFKRRIRRQRNRPRQSMCVRSGWDFN